MDREWIERSLPQLHGQLPGSLELAYLGDAVYELYVRGHLVRRSGRVRDLHQHAVAYVNARAQANALCAIESRLTEEERDVVKRARNAHQTPPRNQDAHDYHLATAFEALLGYLALREQYDRMEELIRPIFETEGA